MTVHEYVTNPATGTVHLVSQLHLTIATHPQTRCGVTIPFYGEGRWESGDETISGIAATCETCRQVVGR